MAGIASEKIQTALTLLENCANGGEEINAFGTRRGHLLSRIQELARVDMGSKCIAALATETTDGKLESNLVSTP